MCLCVGLSVFVDCYSCSSINEVQVRVSIGFQSCFLDFNLWICKIILGSRVMQFCLPHWNAISEEGVANFVHGVLILCRLVIIKICCRKYVVETFYGATFIYQIQQVGHNYKSSRLIITNRSTWGDGASYYMLSIADSLIVYTVFFHQFGETPKRHWIP